MGLRVDSAEEADNSLMLVGYLRMYHQANHLWKSLMVHRSCYWGWRVQRKGIERGFCLSLKRVRSIPMKSGGRGDIFGVKCEGKGGKKFWGLWLINQGLFHCILWPC